MYRCADCGSMFDEPESVSYCKEDYNGVSDIFSRRTWGTYDACPYCGSEEIDSYWEEDDDEIL